MKQNLKINAEISIDLLLIAYSDDAIIITDPQGIIIWANSSFERISEFSSNMVSGQPITFLCGTFTDREVIDQIHHSLRAGHSFVGDVLQYRRSGNPFWISLSLTPVRYEDAVTHFVAVLRDITARKEIERQIARLQAQLSGIKYLEGWITQCAWDKTVKDKKGNFISLENFIEYYTDARFTHGISPEAHARVKKKKKS